MKDNNASSVVGSNLAHVYRWFSEHNFVQQSWRQRADTLTSKDKALVDYQHPPELIKHDGLARYQLITGAVQDVCLLCESIFEQGKVGMTPDGRSWLCICCYQYLVFKN